MNFTVYKNDAHIWKNNHDNDNDFWFMKKGSHTKGENHVHRVMSCKILVSGLRFSL